MFDFKLVCSNHDVTIQMYVIAWYVCITIYIGTTYDWQYMIFNLTHAIWNDFLYDRKPFESLIYGQIFEGENIPELSSTMYVFNF